MELKFRKLKAEEIDVRLGTQKLEDPKDKKSRIVGASYLLYKDARVDMSLLDEVVGPMNWQRTHEFKDGKLYCNVGIFDENKNTWVWKEDVGVESNEEAEKGQASDSFKRACFNWGIGRELYTAPFIWITPFDNEDLRKTKMSVELIDYDENGISKLRIVDNKGNVRYTMGCFESTNTRRTPKNEKKVDESKPEAPQKYATPEQIAFISSFGESAIKWCLSKYKVENLSNLTFENANEIIDGIKKGKK